MGKIVQLSNSTLVSGATSTGNYLVGEINSKIVGLPIYTFTYTNPPLDFIAPSTDLIISNATILDQASFYGVGLALTVNTSSYCVPIYRLTQNDDVFASVKFIDPTVVSNLTDTGNFLITLINNTQYGIPLYTFSTQFPFTSSVAMTSINITTKIVNENILNISKNSGSTYLNPKIKAYSDLILRVKRAIGYPSIQVEICDENIVEFIDQSLEMFSKYVGITEETLAFHTRLYTRGYGLNISDLFSVNPEMYTTYMSQGSASYDYDLLSRRKVIECFSVTPGYSTGVNTLFSIENFLMQSLYFGNLAGGVGYSLVDWQILQGMLKQRGNMLGQNPYWSFNQKTQVLRILPEPSLNDIQCGGGYWGCIGCWVENRISEMLNEPWVYQYTLGLTMRGVGLIRGKYNMALFGNATLNYNTITEQGLKIIDECERDLIQGTGLADAPPPRFFVG